MNPILKWLLPALLFAIGLVSLAAGVANYLQEEHFFATAAQATGTLSDFVYVSRSQYCADYVYADREGQRQELVNSADCASSKQPGRLGETIQIYYDPRDPGRTGQVRGLAGPEGSLLIIGLFAFAVFSLVGLGLLLLPVIRRRRQPGRPAL